MRDSPWHALARQGDESFADGTQQSPSDRGGFGEFITIVGHMIQTALGGKDYEIKSSVSQNIRAEFKDKKK